MSLHRITHEVIRAARSKMGHENAPCEICEAEKKEAEGKPPRHAEVEVTLHDVIDAGHVVQIPRYDTPYEPDVVKWQRNALIAGMGQVVSQAFNKYCTEFQVSCAVQRSSVSDMVGFSFKNFSPNEIRVTHGSQWIILPPFGEGMLKIRNSLFAGGKMMYPTLEIVKRDEPTQAFQAAATFYDKDAINASGTVDNNLIQHLEDQKQLAKASNEVLKASVGAAVNTYNKDDIKALKSSEFLEYQDFSGHPQIPGWSSYKFYGGLGDTEYPDASLRVKK